MEANILFSEQQRFKQWWLWLTLLIAAAFPVFGLLREVQSNTPFADSEENTGFLISLLVMGIVVVLFSFLRLETQITEKGITVRFFPFHLKFMHFSWQEIEQAYVREYAPISEYGGWGLRYGMLGSGKAYNVSGNQGLQLVFKNGKKLLIGTNKPAEVAATLSQFQPIKN